MLDFVSSASNRRRLASVFRGFSAACRTVIGAAFQRASIIAQTAKRDETRQSARASALSNLTALQHRKYELQVEKEILAAERKEAVRMHRKVASFDRRLKAITNELLSIG